MMHYTASFIDFTAKLGLKLTSLRKEVLYILWEAGKPLKAYEILETLSKDKLNFQAPSIYRALDFFVVKKVVHKIESIQSYTLCCEPLKQLSCEVLMVCIQCHQVIEVHDSKVQDAVFKLTTIKKFHLNQDIIELKGTCSDCGIKK